MHGWTESCSCVRYTAGGVDFERLFRHYDRDNSGSLDFEEFRSAMRRDAKVAKRDVSDTELKQVFGSVDIDGGGEIDIDEFVAWINTDDKPEDIVLETPSPRRRRRVSRMHTCTHTCMHTQPAGCTVLCLLPPPCHAHKLFPVPATPNCTRTCYRGGLPCYADTARQRGCHRNGRQRTWPAVARGTASPHGALVRSHPRPHPAAAGATSLPKCKHWSCSESKSPTHRS